MLSLLERTISGVDRRLLLLAPPDTSLPPTLRAIHDPLGHRQFVRELQRLRGRVYLADGALKPEQLLNDGRHRSPEDQHSWHLLMLGGDGRPHGCISFRNHVGAVGLEQLRVRGCPLARDEEWRDGLRQAVEAEIALARRERLHYAEVGGWALSEECRRTPDGIVLALAVFAFGRLLGGALGITTATVRHCSSTILRRLGGVPLRVNGAPIPVYHDPHYRCEMELLRFDSRRPHARYAEAIDLLFAQLHQVTILASPAAPTGALPLRASYESNSRGAIAAA